jgi:hypothetical protein
LLDAPEGRPYHGGCSGGVAQRQSRGLISPVSEVRFLPPPPPLKRESTHQTRGFVYSSIRHPYYGLGCIATRCEGLVYPRSYPRTEHGSGSRLAGAPRPVPGSAPAAPRTAAQQLQRQVPASELSEQDIAMPMLNGLDAARQLKRLMTGSSVSTPGPPNGAAKISVSPLSPSLRGTPLPGSRTTSRNGQARLRPVPPTEHQWRLDRRTSRLSAWSRRS